jgi:hypothetical protein
MGARLRAYLSCPPVYGTDTTQGSSLFAIRQSVVDIVAQHEDSVHFRIVDVMLCNCSRADSAYEQVANSSLEHCRYFVVSEIE